VKQLEEIRELTDKALNGLHADDALRKEIIEHGEMLRHGERVIARNTPWQETDKQKALKKRLQPVKRVAALSACGIFTVGLLIGLPLRISTPVTKQNTDQPVLRTLAVENEDNATFTVQTAGDEVSNDTAMSVARSVPVNGITITKSAHPAYRGIWAAASGANYPLISVSGRYYRLLTAPTDIGSDMLGSALGTVEDHTSEPALSGAGIVSNTAAQGETVYAVSGMNGAMVACKVDGKLRVFQRVSYGSTALKSGESLADTLKASSITAMELTGVGTVTDAAKAKELYNILVSNASLVRPSSSETNTTLLLQLSNGLAVQLCVKDDSVMACGTWSCPEFFEAFGAAVQ